MIASRRLPLVLATAGTLLTSAAAVAQGPSCAPGARCQKVASFVATITDLKPSVSGGDRLIAITLDIRNATDKVLRLGYVQGSGLATDERGNRYGLLGMRGIGEITTNAFDPKFVLSPGESAVARFEFAWRPTRGAIYGSRYDVELSLREIDPVTGTQFQLGREHVLVYKGLGEPSTVAQEATAAAPPRTEAVATAVPEEADPCDDKPRCYSGGSFIAEVTQLTPSVAGRHHVLTVQVKFRNLGTEPLILAYRSGSSVAIDELGNRYGYGRPGTHDTSVQGMGLASSTVGDARFGLRPGESRNATFTIVRFNATGKQIGTAWGFDATLVELIPVNQAQARHGREFAMTFQELTAAGGGKKAVRSLLDAVTKKTKPGS